MRIATWNVNSIRQRLDHVRDYLKAVEPDVLCLQAPTRRWRAWRRSGERGR